MKKVLLALWLVATTLAGSAGEKNILFIPGPPSHGPGEHEYRAGCLLLKSCLEKVPSVASVLCFNSWPQPAEALDGASTIVLFMDGGPGHPALQNERLEK